ncbi:flagellar hook-length control protein FliK [Polynucleobacter sp. MG-Unter2-18]|uniref:flagellar hook-length control protein FliK n=1 Tax=Polynucleobacter sp. MG-Unter2-18 TaxID=2081052 RepID=UPI001BFD8F1B|nr:flagellar hook-length control protein FliK [Polynucleobacter sp. MG-Unter2-18]QWD94977.1 flagellar hook-length control protein FliK [Polynucleobacter sp. MG-Unter2-18]
MPTVSQIQMQAAVSPFSEAIAQPGSLAGGSAMPVGFDTFLSSLNQKMLARLDARTDSAKFSSPKTGLGTLGMQNLPGFIKQDKDSAKITDPMQLLAAQLAAQGLIGPVVNQPTVSNPLLNSGLGVNAVDSSKTMAGLNLPSALGLKGQNIDSQQNQLITQSLARAMKEAGQGNNLGAQNPQVAQLMQMLQQAQPTNTAQASALEQLKGLVAQAGQTSQTASPAPKITLTPELASAIRDLAQQAQPTNTAQASALEQLKGLVAQAGQTSQTASPAPKITLTPELASAIRDLAQQAQPTNTAQASALEQLKGLVAQAGQTSQTASPAPKITLTPELASAIRDLAQQAQPTNTAQASALEQLKGLVAQAGQTSQTASPAPKITLTPELASAIRDLAQQAQPTNTAQASALEQLKGLVAQAGQTSQTSPQVSSSDPKPALVVTTSTVGVAEKLSTPPLDSHSISKDQNSAIISSQNMKNSDNSLIPLYAGQASKENKGLEVAPRITPASDFHVKELEKIDELASQDLNSLSAQYSGLARLDSQTSEALQKFQIKQTEASFVSGPLLSEIMSAAKSGGGRIMFELTPPEQGTIRIDLQINQNGHAHLIVEGASDATKSRLDQGGQNLKQEFAQMGLNLSLDLRQGNQSQQASGQSFNNARQDYYASQQTTNPNPKNLATIDFIGSGHNTSASGTVHLFA